MSADQTEDVTSWLLLKYRAQSNRARHDKELARVIETMNTLSLTKLVTDVQTRPSGQSEGNTGARAYEAQGDGKSSGNDGREPKRLKSSYNGGGNSGGGPPQDNASAGDAAPPSGHGNAIVCKLCTGSSSSFTTLDDLL